jgi:hypothetical protein
VGRSIGNVWVTPRDEMALSWFRIVRISNVQTVRWLLGAVNGWERPVQIRQAQRWVSRMETAGMIRRVNIGGPGGAVVWGTFEATQASRPNIYAQTTRHEIAVSAASARFAAAGWAWQRDQRPDWTGGHQADGVALGIGDDALLIEVELTPKRAPRYVQIFSAYSRRLVRGDALRVVYLCNPDSARAVRSALRQPTGHRVADRVEVHEVFDTQTTWRSETLPAWITPPQAESEETRALVRDRAAEMPTLDRLVQTADLAAERGANGPAEQNRTRTRT